MRGLQLLLDVGPARHRAANLSDLSDDLLPEIEGRAIGS